MTPMTCTCRSHNRPERGGEAPEIVLAAPDWCNRPTICVDACIAKAIEMLWANGVVTGGCCCGHNRDDPSVVIETYEDAEKTKRLLKANDARPWKVFQWRLTKT